MARNHDQPPQTQPHFASERESLGRFNDRLMFLRDQVMWDKASVRINERRIEEAKAVGDTRIIRLFQAESDRTLDRVRAFERQIKELEMRLFGK